MSKIMHMTRMYIPTLREVPSDAELASHRLLLRGAMMRKNAAGLYTFLPLGMLVLNKIERIIDEEMQNIGAEEILMPFVQPADIWHESGRWDDYGPELARMTDRHDVQYCLGPTHEELITSIVRNELRSYKQLPVYLYQTQVKFRDEIRPRFGLLRSREFIMKDGYSFHDSEESLQETYDATSKAYGRMCDRMGLKWRAVDADSGQIGGKVSTEFMALASSGEAELVYCECDYASDVEAAPCKCKPTFEDYSELELVHTPHISTIDDLADFLDIPTSSCVKALAGRDAEGEIYVFFVPGDHEVNMIKVDRIIDGFVLLDDEELKSAGLVKGFMGPVNLPSNVHVIGDINLQSSPSWIIGANKTDYHYVGARLDKDFSIQRWEDLCEVSEGDFCPVCGKTLHHARGIEVSQVFQLGTKYSESMGATYMDENGKEKPFIMGCYGVGVSRSLAAIVEQNHDEMGIKWPASVAPAHIHIVPLAQGDDLVQPYLDELLKQLSKMSYDVIVDDRKERAGVKFADADLIGCPVQIVLGKRGLKDSKVELKNRATLEKRDVFCDELFSTLKEIIPSE